MKSISYILIIFIGLFISNAFQVKAAAGDDLTSPARIHYDPNHPAAPGEILVKFKPATFSEPATQIDGTVRTSQASVNAIFTQLSVRDMTPVFRAKQTPSGGIYRLRFDSPLSLPEALEKMAADPNVEWLHPNYLYRTFATPNDPFFPNQWGLAKIQAEQAWNISQGDPNIIIAVIDTGVDYDHLDLEDNIWHNPGEIPGNELDDDGNGYIDDDIGWDFVDADSGYPGEDISSPDRDPMDFHGHGTGCSGIASAATNNSIGMAGTAWNCKIMAVRAGYKNEDGGGILLDSDIKPAMEYAADNGAHVISMSWGGRGGSFTMEEAMDYAHAAGCVLVAAAGNDNDDATQYPAAYPNVISVAASDEDDDRAYFSNYGWWVDIAAPGVNIHGTTFDPVEHNSTYSLWNGTSMSTPIVAGAAALLLSQNPKLTHDEVKARLIDTADDVGWLVRLNMYNALLTPPDAPINLAATAISSTQIDLTWDNVSDESGYEIQHKKAGEDFQQIGTTASDINSYSDTALQPDTNYTYRVRAYNAAGNSDWSDDATAMTLENNPPDVSLIPDVSFDEDGSDSSIDLDDYVTDAENTPAEMTWEYSGNVEVSVDIDPSTHVVTFTAPENWNGSNGVTFTATDTGGLSDSDDIIVTVNPVNDPPVVDDIPDATFDEDGSHSGTFLDDYVTDPDNIPAEMTWTYTGDTDVIVDIDPSTHEVVFTAPTNWNGSNEVTFTAKDSGESSGSDTITVTVNPVNDPPVVDPIPDVSFDEDGSHSEIELDDYVSDIDNTDDDITWTFTDSDNIIVYVDIASGRRANFMALPDWNGSEIITFTAKDPGELSDNYSITVTVNAVNDAPAVYIAPDVSFDEDSSDTIDLDDYVTDPDNTAAEMTWTYTGNTDVTVDIKPTTHVVTFAAPANWNGGETITFTAKDPGELSGSDSVTITVNPVNDPPILDTISNVSFDEDGSQSGMDLDDYVSDVDDSDDDMTWTYTGNTDVNIEIDSTASHIVTFTASDNWNGSENITFTVKDPGELSASKIMTVTVNAVNDAPVVNITADVSFDEDSSDSIDLDDYVTDPDNTPGQMTWTYAGNTGVIVSVNPATHVATFSAPVNWNGNDNVTFTAKDPGELSGNDTVAVTVNAVNDAPVVNITADVSFDEDSSDSIDLDNYVTDTDNIPAEMTWTYAGNTDVSISIDSITHVATFTAPINWNGNEAITFTARDLGELSDGDVVTVTVNPVNDPPALETIPDVSFDEDGSHSEIDLDDYVSDIDNSDDEMTWTYAGSTDVNIEIDSSASHIVTFTASVDWNGSETITFTVKDPGELSDSRSMTVTINAVNDAPTVTNLMIEPLIPELGDDLNASYTYSDVDGGTETSAEIKWYKNGAQQPYDGVLTIPSSATLLGEEWHFTARPGDGIDTGELKTSPSVVIDGLAQAVHLYPGQNFISLYVDAASTDLLSILAPIEGLYTSVSTYDAASGKWKQYAPDGLHILNDLNTIEYKKGYVIDMIGEAVFTIIGERITDTSVFLHRGWNFVGYSSPEIQLRADALLSIDGLYIYVWTYDNLTGIWQKYVANDLDALNTLVQMNPGWAYWIYVAQNCTWILPP